MSRYCGWKDPIWTLIAAGFHYMVGRNKEKDPVKEPWLWLCSRAKHVCSTSRLHKRLQRDWFTVDLCSCFLWQSQDIWEWKRRERHHGFCVDYFVLHGTPVWKSCVWPVHPSSPRPYTDFIPLFVTFVLSLQTVIFTNRKQVVFVP